MCEQNQIIIGEKIGHTSTSFGINLSPDNCNKKSPASLFKLRRANVEKIGLTSTSFGINLSPDNCNKKSPASLFKLRRANVEKIGLTSTSFGINLSPDNCNKKAPLRFSSFAGRMWRRSGSNRRPLDCQSSALAN